MKKIFFSGTFLVNLGIIFYFWYSRSSDLLFYDQAGMLIALGRIMGLLAVYLILWQLILIGRVKFIEKVFGLDRLAIIHHFNGLISWVFIFLHPLLIILGYKMANKLGFWSQIKNFLFNWEGMATAFLGLIIFGVVIFISLAAIKRKMKYEAWYFVHLLTYLAIIMAFDHQLEYGYTLQDKVFFVYWQFLYWAVISVFVYFRFLKPAKLFFDHRFSVLKIEKESDNVFSIYIGGEKMEAFDFLPGQFAIFRFLQGKLALEAHPFSFSQTKNGKDIRISVKHLGDFTKVLSGKLKIGTKVIIDGPHGIFTSRRTDNKKLALLSGGIGVTPIRSLAEGEQDRDLVILYAAASANDFVFQNEFNSFKSAAKTYLISGQADNWSGETGRIDEEKIKRLISDYSERSFYVCGPPLFLKNVIKALKKLKVSGKNIYFEKFSLS